MAHAVVVDVGSSAVKAVLWDAKGDKVRSVSAQCHGASVKGGRPCGPETVLGMVQVVEDCLDQLLSDDVCDFVVSDLVLTGFSMNLFGVDNSGNVITPFLTYASGATCSSVAASKQLEAHPSAKIIEERTGTKFHHVSYASSQLLGLDETLDRASKSKVSSLTCFASFLLSKWTECSDLRNNISLSEASWTGLVSLKTMDWDTLALNLLPPWCHCLPKIQHNGRVDGRTKIRGQALNRWPCLENAQLHYGVSDGVAANVGSMCVNQKGEINEALVAITVGTSAAVRAIVPRALMFSSGGEKDEESRSINVIPPGLWCYCISKEFVIIGGSLTDGGSIRQWLSENFNIADETEELAAALPVGQHNLVVLPFLNGERSTGWRQDATMTIHGLQSDTAAPAILRACMEAIALRLAVIISQLEVFLKSIGIPKLRLVGSGGVLEKSKVLPQAIADASGVGLYSCSKASGGLLTALGARNWALGIEKEEFESKLFFEEKGLLPDPHRTQILRQELVKQDALYKKMYGQS